MTTANATGPKRWSTIVWGAIPVGILGVALSLDHIPFTDIALTVPYAAQGPGPTFNTLGEIDGTAVVDVEGAEVDETSGHLNMTTVSVRTNMTLAQALGRWIGTDDSIVPIEQVLPSDLSEDELREFNQASFVASEASATVAAMNYLHLPTLVVVHDVVEGSAAENSLEPEDVITAVDGIDVSAPGQVQNLVKSRTPGERLALTLERGGQSRDVEVTLGENPEDPSVPQLGILMTSRPAGDVAVRYNLQDVGGPSAGMMFSLAVIDKLSPGELNGGKFVSGTGTIAEDGSVGPIGGITHKISGASDAGAQLFLAPEDNCKEASKAKSGDMVVASVATLNDAVEAMSAFNEGREVRTCG